MKNFHTNGYNLKLEIPPSVFEPNTTTHLLVKHMDDLQGKTVLDLGCGSGPIAIIAAKKGAKKVYAVDIMEEACQVAAINAKINGVGDCVEVKQGDLFEPIKGLKFDVIINDVSGMAEEVSRISPWYPEAIPTGGEDGTAPTVRMLQHSLSYLEVGGRLLFPVLSLARSSVIISTAKEIYNNNLQQITSKIIPFCEELQINIDLLIRLKDEGIISFTKQRSRYIWNLDIYQATRAL